jgi:subtilisin family serine protease
VATYWVDFKNTADLSQAYFMNWSERGWFVYETLKEQAEKTQSVAKAYLDNAGVKYRSFWIANRILVEQSDKTVLASLQQLPNVVSISAQKEYILYEPEKEKLGLDDDPKAIEPNITHVKAPEAWALGYDGTGLVVANVDTGVRYSHQALVGSYRGNNGDGTFDHNYNWFNPDDLGDDVPRDGNSHGTHTMGTMVGDDGGANQIGIAPGAQWMACAGCPDGGCTDSALLGCGEFIAAPTDLTGNNANPDMRPNVVNNSWGDCGQTYDPWFEEVIDGWQAAGVYPVFSNGNASNCGYPAPPGLNTVGNPARSGNVTGVGSSGEQNGLYATHSNWGPTDNLDTVNPVDGFAMLKPQVLAPGVSIRSSTPGSDTAYQDGWSGTSMSAPHVTGLVAMIMQAAPCLVGDYATIETLIESTAVDMTYNDGSALTPTDFPNFATGWGEIDALAAVQLASGMCGNSVLYGTVTSDTAEPISGAKVEITGTDPVNNRTVYTNAAGQYTANVNADTFEMAVSAFGYEPATASGVVVADGASVLQDFVLTELPNTLVTGVVYDDGILDGAAHGYPLYAKLTFSMTGYSETVYSDPMTGEYEIVLYNSQEYSVNVQALVPGYQLLETTITPDDVEVYIQDYYLNIDNVACSAPGYSPEYEIMYDFEAGDQGFVSSGTNSSWARGIPTNGPGEAHSGSYVIATNPTGNYNSSELSYMTSPLIDLTGFGTDTPVIEFWQWRHIESATWDNATVEVTKNGTTWTPVYGPVGGMTDTGYNKVVIALDPSYNVATFQVRFKFKSDSSVNYEGWYVDDIGIAAAPVPAPTQVYFENFDTTDGGFTVTQDAGAPLPTWAWGIPSATPGPGAAYSAPNVWATNLIGNYAASERSYLVSPVIDLSSYVGMAPTLSFWHWMDSESNTWDWGSVQVSKDGGATWQAVYEKFGDILTWSPKSIALDASYAVANFQFRFFLRTDSSGQYPGWYIDNVAISVSEPYEIAVPCGTISGGIVAGYVYDANFPTEKLIGATVATETTSAMTIANADDPDHAGLYYMFQATDMVPADVEFTVSLPKYETKIETRGILQDVVNHEDFELGAGMLSADPTELERTIWLHDDPEFATLTLINDGAGGANFKFAEKDQGFQPYSIPAFTGKMTESLAPVSIFRDPNAAATVGSLELNALSGRYGITAAPPAYGVDLFNDNLYVWPDASVPGTSTLVGTPTSGATALFAGDFMGSDFGTLYAVSYDNNNLYAIDTATATTTLIGTTTPTSGATFSGLAGGPGVMYGMATACNTSSTLMEVDIATGATTSIGTLPNGTCIIDIAYVPDDGMLYGVDLVSNSLHRIDPETGVDTIVGDLGADPNYAQGMDYDEENKVLYWASYTTGPELRIIDVTTGASVAVGAFTQGEVDAFAIAAGGAGGGVSWLDEVPVEGYVPAFGDFAVQIEFNVDDIEQPGDYFAELKISTDTPYPVPNIPVTLHVVRPFDYGNIKGNITATEKCDVNPAPFTDATINFYKNGVLAFSTGTDETGYYSYALKNGTYDVEVMAEGYVSQMVFGVVVGMSTETFVDFQLRLDDSCLTVEPDSFYQELNPDETATQTMTLINTGALEAPFEISERPGAGPVPYSKAFGVELVLDDGVAEDAIGIGGTAEFMVVNRFTPAEDQFPFVLEQVDISFEASGAVAAGDALRIVVYQNTTGSVDPAPGSELLYQQDVVVGTASGWNNYVLDEPILLSGPGDVLIGAIFLEVPGSSYFPASIDQTASQERSWAGWWSGAVPTEPTLPPDASWILIDDAGFAGNWTIRGMGSAGSTDIVWLTEDPTAGVVAPDGGSVDVTLTFDSTGLTWGDYFGSLRVNSPSEATMNIPVQLRLLAPADYGFAQGNVFTLEVCNVNPAPAANTAVNFLQDGVVVYSILTNSDGYYTTAIPEGTYDIAVEIDGYETQTVEGLVIIAGEETVQDLTLRLLAPCLQAAPVELEKYLLPDTTGTQILKLTNIGAAEGTFELFELPVAGTQAEQLILDPSFEAYTPNPYWDEYSETYGTPLCTEADCGLGGGSGANTGEAWAWFGGASAGDTGYVSQNVLMMPGSATMTFWAEQVVCGDAGASNYMALLIDGIEVWRTDGLDPACGVTGYRMIEVDVSDFADGDTHEIMFESVTVGSGNFFLDDVNLMLEAGGDVLWLSEDPTAGVVPAGGSAEVVIGYDATGLTLGDYFATLRVKNAPAPTIDLPVTLHVVDEIPVFFLYLPLILR